MNWRLILFTLFWITLFIDCYFILMGYQDNRVYTKSILVPLLLIVIYIESADTKHKRSKVIVNFAFLFCFIGDLLLLNDTDANNFVFGLTSFLLAHIFFIIFLYRFKRFSSKHRIFIFLSSFCILCYIGLLLLIVWKNVSVQNFEIPVCVYALVLGFMCFTAIYSSKNRTIKRLASVYFIPGALMFVLSDSILAVNKFYFPIVYAGVFIMITYATAIFLLTNGIIRFLKK